jgi:large subunit ribosomal protein L19
MAHQIIRELDLEGLRKEPLADFEVGDTVNVHTLIKEGDKSRTQIFTGTVIRRNKSHNPSCANFTVRRIVDGEGVERIFPVNSPNVAKVTVERRGDVRRAKLYYLRRRVGKGTKVKELVQTAKA